MTDSARGRRSAQDGGATHGGDSQHDPDQTHQGEAPVVTAGDAVGRRRVVAVVRAYQLGLVGP